MDEAEPLFHAIKKGNAAEVSRLLDGNAALLGARQSGVSPLLTAVYYQQAAVARLLLDRGAPLDVFEASAVGDAERLRDVLAGEPARANEFAADGFTPLGLASFFAHPAVARLLLASGADPSQAARNATRVAPLHSAVAGGSVEIVRELLAHGADVHARQEGGFTPLHSAAGEGRQEMVRLLLAHGADGAARSDAGKTPADMARERGHDAITELLSPR
jgi:ankyrin repeat protein